MAAKPCSSREQGKERPLRIPQMVQAGWDARPASRDGSEAMAMHKKKEISSVPAAGHGIGLLAERQAMATGS